MYMGTLRRHIILWLLLVPVGLCGQKNTPVTVTCENRFVGRDCVSGDSIPAVLYRFNRRVERIPVLDTVAGRAIVQFRDITKNGKYLEPVGPMISMELSDGAVLWQRDIGYIFGHTWIDEELIVETDLNKSRRSIRKRVRTCGKRKSACMRFRTIGRERNRKLDWDMPRLWVQGARRLRDSIWRTVRRFGNARSISSPDGALVIW